jgi:Leucine-rich repeat (LRR) protein
MKMIAILFLMIASVSGIDRQDSLTLTQLFSPEELTHFKFATDTQSGRVVSLFSISSDTTINFYMGSQLIHRYPTFSINDNIEKLDKLRTLSLRGTIRGISSKLYQLVNLDSLSIWNVDSCGFPNTIDDTISNLVNLKYLQVRNSSVSIIPEKIAKLTKLEYLDLSYNRITSMPSTIDQLVSLKTLILDRNFLETLPSEIGNIAKLCTLSIRNNQLIRFPEMHCPLLKSFDATNNDLEEFPTGIWNSNELTTLIIWENRITSIPEGNWNWSKLERFYYDEKWVHQVPPSMPIKFYNPYNHPDVDKQDSIIMRTLLDYLGFRHTQVWDSTVVKWGGHSALHRERVVGFDFTIHYLTSTFNQDIYELPGIEKFDSLKSVKVPFLPRSLCSMTNLRTIKITKLPSKTLPKEIGNLVNLDTLICDACSLNVLPEELGSCYNLRYLSMIHNQLTSLPEAFSNLTNLEYLFLAENKISSITLDNQEKLKYLHLNNNGLQHCTLKPSANLVYVYLERNRLTEIPSGFFNCLNLKTLRLGNNYIAVIPPEIKKLRLLEILDLTNNALRTIPVEITALTTVERTSFNWGPQTIFDGNNICFESLSPEVIEWIGYDSVTLQNIFECENDSTTPNVFIASEITKSQNCCMKNGILYMNNIVKSIVTIDLFDASGKKIACLYNGTLSGALSIPLSRYMHSAGVYFARICTNKHINSYKYVNQ